jgi:hypothetical protein
MKRAINISLIILLMDQLLKWYFQTYFEAKRILLSENFGFTFVTNPGIYI